MAYTCRRSLKFVYRKCMLPLLDLQFVVQVLLLVTEWVFWMLNLIAYISQSIWLCYDSWAINWEFEIFGCFKFALFVTGGSFEGESEQIDLYKNTASVLLLFTSLLSSRENSWQCWKSWWSPSWRSYWKLSLCGQILFSNIFLSFALCAFLMCC